MRTNDNPPGSDWFGLTEIYVEDIACCLDDLPENSLQPSAKREFVGALTRRMLMRDGCPVVIAEVVIKAAKDMIDYTFPDEPPTRPEVDFG